MRVTGRITWWKPLIVLAFGIVMIILLPVFVIWKDERRYR
jgi:hypothetical protein